MAYIDKELFEQDIKMRYCNNCARPNEIKCRACHIDDMLGEIEDAPTADVEEVVRCKDCKKFIKKGEEFLVNDVFGICEKSRTGFFDDGEEVYGNDFCSYGERSDAE